MKRVVGNEWDGFDTGPNIYEAEAERKYQSSIWKILTVVSVIAILALTVSFMAEWKLIRTGHAITAEYGEEYGGVQKATYYGEDGKQLVYRFTDKSAAHTKDRIVIYKDNEGNITLRTSWRYWAVRYGILAGVMCFSLWRIRKIYRNTKQ
jgi:hypothetical protein